MASVIPLTRTQDFSTVKCGECGIVFAIETWLREKWINERHGGYYCPNGHARAFIMETDAERIERELTSQLNDARRDAEWARVRANAAEKQVSAAKGVVTKLKKRMVVGVCPCCHRTFKQLAAHMAQKHPTFPSDSHEL